MSVSYKDYYKILGVAKTADLKAIKQAYRRLARKHHPDQNPGNPAAIERFKEATEAYEVLSDPEKRRRYDELGPDWARQAERASEGAPRGGFEDLGGFRVHVGRDADLGGFSDFFRTFFGDLGRRAGADPESAVGGDFFRGGGRGRRGARGASRGDDLEGAVEISLEEAAQGSRRIVEFQSAQVCRTCGGTGRQAEAVCPTCQGQGQILQPHRVEVKIPVGVRDGSRVRVAGEGGAGAGGRGDLFLRVRVTPHPLFERRDDDIHLELPVAAWEAALGAEVEVPTLRGKVSMKVPPGTSSGQTFRLPGYGVPHVKGEGRGDQLVRVKIVMPRDLGAREQALFEELRALRPTPPRD